jgi:putative dehydrogenase
MNRFGVIGAGNMGGGMVENLLSKGWDVHVHDIDQTVTQRWQACGAVIHDSPQALTTACKVFAVVVIDQPQVNAVLEGPTGILGAIGSTHTVILCPTLLPDDVQSTGSRIEAQGAAMIDAPMSGGPARAANGSMSLMVACTQAVFAQHASLLQTLANPVFHVGHRLGDGARTKLVNNLLAAIHLVGISEILNLAQKVGLDPATTLEVIESSSGQSWIGSDRMARALKADWRPLAHMTLLAKDSRLAHTMATAAGYDVPLGSAAMNAFVQACQSGWADFDDGAILAFLRGDAIPESKTNREIS